MPQAKGSKSQLLIQEETTFGVAPAVPAMQLLYYSTCDLALTRGQEQDSTLRGNRNPVKASRGKNSVEGNIVANLQAYNPILYKGLLGSVTTTGSASPYTHVFKVGDSLPSFIIEKGFLNISQYFKYLGCKVSSMSVGFTPYGQQPVTFGIMGAAEATTSTTSFDAAPEDLTYAPFDGLAWATLEEGGAAIANVTALSLSISNDVDGEQYLLNGHGNRADLPEGTFVVTGSMTTRFTDVALYTKAINDTASSLKASFARGTGLGTVGNEMKEFFIPELTFSPKSPAIQGPKGIVAELAFTGYYSTAAGASALQITLMSPTATI